MRREDFERLYEAHAAKLLAFLVYRTADVDLAEDVLADTFERVLTTRWRFDPRRGSEKTWLYSIALNRLRDHQRRAAVEDRALAAVAAGMSAMWPPEGIPLEDRDAVLKALASLPEDEREALALRYGADLTVPEIAKIARLKPTTVKGRIYRGLRRLRRHMA